MCAWEISTGKSHQLYALFVYWNGVRKRTIMDLKQYLCVDSEKWQAHEKWDVNVTQIKLSMQPLYWYTVDCCEFPFDRWKPVGVAVGYFFCDWKLLVISS